MVTHWDLSNSVWDTVGLSCGPLPVTRTCKPMNGMYHPIEITSYNHGHEHFAAGS